MAGHLRLEHKQASLEELGQLHEPPLTKDAIAGRIRRLLAMADKRAEELGIPDTEASLTPEMLAEDALRPPRRTTAWIVPTLLIRTWDRSSSGLGASDRVETFRPIHTGVLL